MNRIIDSQKDLTELEMKVVNISKHIYHDEAKSDAVDDSKAKDSTSNKKKRYFNISFKRFVYLIDLFSRSANFISELSEHERRILEAIKSIYTDESSWGYYLNVVKSLPTSFDQANISWANKHHRTFSNTRKNWTKWKELGTALQRLELIDMNGKQGVIRKFQ